MTPNLTPEQKAREKIDKMLKASGWVIQDMNTINFAAYFGIAISEYQTEVSNADDVLFTDQKQ